MSSQKEEQRKDKDVFLRVGSGEGDVVLRMQWYQDLEGQEKLAESDLPVLINFPLGQE